MFDIELDDEGVPVGEDWDAWVEQVCDGRVPDPEELGQVPASQRAPSGWAALELDQSTVDPARLSDADLIEGIVWYARVSSWSDARQSRLLAEFARRRPAIDTASGLRRSDACSRPGEFAADEVGLALRMSRTIAADRLYTADLLVDLLTGRRCAATGAPEDSDPEDCEGCPGGDCACTPTGSAPAGDDDRGSGGHRCGAGSGAGKPLEHVIVPITMLMGLNETPGELVGHGPIPAALAREIAAEGTWRRLLTDPKSGALLDYGRTTYTPPTGLADHVRARDLYCRSPICRQRAATADLDHTVPYPDGHTSEFNLYAGCRHDHLAKTHAPGWHVEQHPDATITWTTPTGHTYTSRPHDYRAEPGSDPPHPPQDTDPDPPPPF